ncbi:hypothetical protein [Pedobacter flavus]|uniref:Transglutaminase-like domain-containing protein n=1 Tax=Pedobacter flavus TaxID=3113906 RepID=A0ABU7H0G2_9SPHI|nr:hypothetical protein [Pedobacter sp. VNH31]MEE1884718.1 hypothetical protein [Pedobacter sp. VNH31]
MVDLFFIGLSFVFCYYFVRAYKPFVYMTYYDLYHLKRKIDAKEVFIEPNYLNVLQVRSRAIIEKSNSYDELLRNTDILIVELQKKLLIKEDLSKVSAISVLLSTFFAYGNPRPLEEEVGCLIENASLKEVETAPLLNKDYFYLKNSEIGCCTDYAYIMGRYLAHYQFKHRIVSISGHIFNEVEIDGNWFTIDANTGLLASKRFPSSKTNFDLYFLPHFGMTESKYYRQVLVPFREFLTNSFGDSGFAKQLFIEYIDFEKFKPF